jgi:hypothetical protein
MKTCVVAVLFKVSKAKTQDVIKKLSLSLAQNIRISDANHVNIADACRKCYLYLYDFLIPFLFTRFGLLIHSIFLFSFLNHKKEIKTACIGFEDVKELCIE